MNTIHANILQFSAIAAFIIFIIWLIHTQIQNNLLIRDVLSDKKKPEKSGKNGPKSWTQAETTVLAYLLVYKETVSLETLELLSEGLRRSPSSIKRKLLRLKYSNSNGSEMDRNTIRLIIIIGQEKAKREARSSCMMLGLDNQTVNSIFS